jgi:uncharacterized protein YjbI with pentapeptide repeats
LGGLDPANAFRFSDLSGVDFSGCDLSRAFFTELFPTRMRGSGQSFAYNSGRGLGALTPWLVGYRSTAGLPFWLSMSPASAATGNGGGTAGLPLALAMSVLALCAYLLMIIAALLLRETKGADLTSLDGIDA